MLKKELEKKSLMHRECDMRGLKIKGMLFAAAFHFCVSDFQVISTHNNFMHQQSNFEVKQMQPSYENKFETSRLVD